MANSALGPGQHDATDDVFGVMLSAAFEDRSVLEIVEREDGFISRLPACRYFDPVSNGARSRWSLAQSEAHNVPQKKSASADEPRRSRAPRHRPV